MLQPGGTPTKVVCLTQVVTANDLVDDQEYEDIMEDMRQEGGKFGKDLVFCFMFVSHLPLAHTHLHMVQTLMNQLLCAGNLVNVVIPRPNPDHDPTPGVGKVWFQLLKV